VLIPEAGPPEAGRDGRADISTDGTTDVSSDVARDVTTDPGPADVGADNADTSPD
jgi:hypothetical protein